MKKRDWIFVTMIVCASIGLFIYFDRVQILEFVRTEQKEPLPAVMNYQQTQSIPAETTPVQDARGQGTPPITGKKPVSVPVVPKTQVIPTKLAAEINLAVPFTSQAPTGDWNQPFQDACEEASLFMVHEYYAGNASSVIDSGVATKALLDIVAAENKLFGFYKDTTAAQVAQLAESMYGYATSTLIENPTIEQIKTELNKGNPVLLPADGLLLNNPYFTPPGPSYHLIVIRGYTKTNQFITNDPGTKHGNAYVYSFDTIMNALHDWNNGADMSKGKKVILILHPKK